jgi:malate dehydrogenase (oxaloacetate-decarboxylating)(NADP+)
VVANAYRGEDLKFGPDYLIPKPFDLRLIVKIAPAVAKAAMDSGVATLPIEDFDAYHERLCRFVFRSGMLMKPVFDAAVRQPKRLVYAEGEALRVLRAVQMVVDDGLAKPILVGRPDVISARIAKLGLRLKPGRDIEVVNPEDDPRYVDYVNTYFSLMERKGTSSHDARTIIRTNTTVIAAIMVKRNEADAMICGTNGQYNWHLRHVLDVIGLKDGVCDASALSVLIMPTGTFFLCDTHVTPDPSAEELVEMTLLSADVIRDFGVTPKVAMLSHSSFGTSNTASARKVSEAVRLLALRAPDLEMEGEMQGDAAMDEALRDRIFPHSRLSGQANLFVLPNLDAANCAFTLLKALGKGLPVGPILVGAARPVHILTPSVTARGIVNMSAVAVVNAQSAG